MDADAVRKRLEEACKKAGGQAAFANANDVSPQYVSNVLSGSKEPGESVLAPLGLERVVDYRKKRK